MNAHIITFLIGFSFLSPLLADGDNSMKVLGDSQVKLGLSAIESGNYKDAFRFLTLGVYNSPSNLAGRSALAEFHEIALARPDTAADLMIEGLDLGGVCDINYLKQTLRLLLKHQMDAKIQELADNYLPQEPDDSKLNQALAFAAANANYLRGNYDKAEDYFDGYKLMEFAEGQLLYSQMCWDRGNKELAIANLERSLEKSQDSKAIIMQLSRYHREIGNFQEAHQYTVLRATNDPLSYEPRIELLYVQNASNNLENNEQTITEIIENFHTEQQAMQALANYAADTGNTELAQKTYDIAADQQFKLDVFSLLLMESFLVKKDYASAKTLADTIYQENPDWLPDRWAIFCSLRAVISAAQNGTGKGDPSYLRDFLSDSTITAQTYAAVASRFTENDCSLEAFKVLSVANEKFPANQKTTTEFIRCCLKQKRIDSILPPLQRLLKMRKPDKELLSQVLDQLILSNMTIPNKQDVISEIESLLNSNES